MIRKSRSLRARILFYSGIWTLLALAGTAYVLLGFYRAHIESHYDAHVAMHMEELIRAASLQEDGTLSLTYPPSDPRYNIAHSGWYWEVRHAGRVLARSPSLEGGQIDLPGLLSADMAGTLVVDGPAGQSLRVQTRQVSNGNKGESLLLVGSAPATNIQEEISDISRHILFSFSVLALGILIAMAILIRIALRPMREISESIHNVDMGRAERVSGEFPRDVQPLVNELNHLLDHNAMLLRRARDQLGDLAHSIKNPLTVIDYEAREMKSERGALIRKQAADIADSVKHHLSRARIFGGTRVMGSRCRVKSAAEDLEYALERIYKARALEFDLSELQDISVRCECQDLEEVLGNLMDNACKWAKSRVVVSSRSDQGRVVLCVEDDGPGIPEEDMERAVKRGLRLDETREGSGLGLGIVTGIVEIYDGSLVLSRGRLGGLCATVDLPPG
jgi:signal transduction histidine kinase